MNEDLTWKQRVMILLYFLLMMIGAILLHSCVPVHVYDLNYKIDRIWVVQGSKYRYVYFITNGRKAIFLHSNSLYKVDKNVVFNEK